MTSFSVNEELARSGKSIALAVGCSRLQCSLNIYTVSQKTRNSILRHNFDNVDRFSKCFQCLILQ